jgi:hypothetical protein
VFYPIPGFIVGGAQLFRQLQNMLELAVAAGDAPIVTFNRRDFRRGELRFPSVVVQTPAAWLNSQDS